MKTTIQDSRLFNPLSFKFFATLTIHLCLLKTASAKSPHQIFKNGKVVENIRKKNVEAEAPVQREVNGYKWTLVSENSSGKFWKDEATGLIWSPKITKDQIESFIESERKDYKAPNMYTRMEEGGGGPFRVTDYAKAAEKYCESLTHLGKRWFIPTVSTQNEVKENAPQQKQLNLAFDHEIIEIYNLDDEDSFWAINSQRSEVDGSSGTLLWLYEEQGKIKVNTGWGVKGASAEVFCASFT